MTSFLGRSFGLVLLMVVIGAPTAFGECFEYQKLTASDARWRDQFGSSVSLSGNVAVVGVHLDNFGSAYVYRYNGSIWPRGAKADRVRCGRG